MSERYGRKPIFVIAWIPYLAFSTGCALSRNIASLLVFRFLSGCFAAAPLTNVGGMIADMWDADHRGDALAIFALAPFSGPAVAPVVAGVLAVKGISWRWMFWIETIYGGVCFGLILLVLPETYLPYLTHKEAQKIRKETGDDGYYTEWERKNRVLTIRARLSMTILKPFIVSLVFLGVRRHSEVSCTTDDFRRTHASPPHSVCAVPLGVPGQLIYFTSS